MDKKRRGGRYIGAYRDDKDRIRPITPRKGRGSKTGIPVRARRTLTVHRDAHHREGYTRKDGTKVAPAEIPATTFEIKDRGAPGRGRRVIPEMEVGELRKHGYDIDKTEEERHGALRKSIKEDGATTTWRRLHAQVIFRKNARKGTDAYGDRIRFEKDRNWVRDQMSSRQRAQMTAKARGAKRGISSQSASIAETPAYGVFAKAPKERKRLHSWALTKSEAEEFRKGLDTEFARKIGWRGFEVRRLTPSEKYRLRSKAKDLSPSARGQLPKSTMRLLKLGNPANVQIRPSRSLFTERTERFYRVRQRDPESFVEMKTPAYATKVAGSVAPGSKVVMGRLRGTDRWLVQSVLVSRARGRSKEDAESTAEKIRYKIEGPLA